MDNEINLKEDLYQYSQKVSYKYSINNIDLNLSLFSFNNIKISNILHKWQSCFGILGKGNIFHFKDVSKIIYCFLTNSCILDNIDGDKVNIDLFNTVTSRFYQVNVLTKIKRVIKLKIFPICDTLVVIDWKNFPDYKIYELYNTKQVKDFYKNKKISFDTIIKDISLEPKYMGNIDELDKDFKILSIVDKEKNIKNLENFLSSHLAMEKQIQKEYKNFIKKLRNHI